MAGKKEGPGRWRGLGRCTTPSVIGEVSKRKAEEAPEAPPSLDHNKDEMVADDGNGLELSSRLKLLLEERKRDHEETVALLNKMYQDLEKEGDIEFDDEANTIEFNEWSKKLWAQMDFSGVNVAGDESSGEDCIVRYLGSPLLNSADDGEEEDHSAAESN